jgi:hypothetical protein
MAVTRLSDLVRCITEIETTLHTFCMRGHHDLERRSPPKALLSGLPAHVLSGKILHTLLKNARSA